MSTPLQKLILESHDSSEDDDGAPILEPVTMEEQLALRAEKRLRKAEEIHGKAEVFRRMGDELFDAKRYEEALIPYLEASRIWPSNTSYFLHLSSTYFKLHWYEEAAHAATRALTLEPTSIEARYTRAQARLEQRLPFAAKVDLETVVAYDPSHRAAQDTLAELVKALDAAKDQHDLPTPSAQDLIDFWYPHYEESPIELDTVSNSSDCNHPGNGIPCKFYNHGRCGKGAYCPYSHAPDEKSVRDDLGRNVCTYFLLDSCKFGEAKCVYSHSREFLPKRGWWTDPEKTAKVKSVIELAEKTAKEQRSLLQSQQKRQASKSKSAGEVKPDTGSVVESAVLVDKPAKQEEDRVEVKKADPARSRVKSKRGTKRVPAKGAEAKENTQDASATEVKEADRKPKTKRRPFHRNTRPAAAASAKTTPIQDKPSTQDAIGTAAEPGPILVNGK